MLNIDSDNKFKYLTQVYWDEVKTEFSAANPQLAKIIDELAPGKDLPLIKIGYRFGDKILENGKFLLLEHIKSQPDGITSQDSKKLQEFFRYAPIPLGIFLNKTCEAFLEIQDRIIPSFVLGPGHTIGLFEAIDFLCDTTSQPLWSTTAGARSIFMLPKINNNIGHKKLRKEFSLTKPPPKAIVNHWEIFVELANNTQNDWQCDIIFFTTPWLEKIKQKDANWAKLREYLFRESWRLSGILTEKTFAVVWQHFSALTMQRGFKPRIYVTDTIRHLISTAYGIMPGFKPATNELLAPIKLIKKAYVDIYNLKQHSPTLLEPCMLTPDNPIIYYSLGYPTLLEGHPETSNINNTITLLKEIQLLMTNMFEYSKRGMVGTEQFVNFIQQTDFDYFHKTPDIYEEVKQTEQLNLEDTNFNDTENFPDNQHFCSTGPFLNGCIRIRRQFPQ